MREWSEEPTLVAMSAFGEASAFTFAPKKMVNPGRRCGIFYVEE